MPVADVFAPDGPLAATFPAYRPRPAQVKLATCIERALAEKKSVLAEGPCGTGKAFAYLVPAIEHALRTKTRVLVSTANIALQSQLVEKDLPALQKALGVPFTFALIKGRSRYLCKRAFQTALDDAAEQLELGKVPERTERGLEVVADWLKTPDVGFADEITAPGEVRRQWPKLSVSSEDCIRKACPHYGDCYAEQAVRAARSATVVVCNHHYFFAHLDSTVFARADEDDEEREDADSDEPERKQRPHVFRDVSAVILDEGHEVSDIAREFFGTSVTEYRVKHLLRRADKLGKKLPEPHVLRTPLAPIEKTAAEYFAELRLFMGSLAGKPSGNRLSREVPLPHDQSDLVGRIRQLMADARDLADNLSKTEEGRSGEAIGDATAIGTSAELLADDLQEFLQLSDIESKVYYLEEANHGAVRIVGKPIAVGPRLRVALFGAGVPVVLTSATLTTAGKFDFIAEEVGFPRGQWALAVDSPFDFARQTLVVMPRLPPPDDPRFDQAANKKIVEVLRKTDGRALVLFTSNKRMESAHAYCNGAGLPYAMLKQNGGDMSRTELADSFREDHSSCLFAVASFWTGIDVPGEALSAVIIDKCPFDMWKDPLVLAMSDILGKAFFGRFYLPRMLLRLRQGVGRLIRSETDRGVIVLLDSRATSKNYGGEVFASLPKTRVVHDLSEIAKFLRDGSK